MEDWVINASMASARLCSPFGTEPACGEEAQATQGGPMKVFQQWCQRRFHSIASIHGKTWESKPSDDPSAGPSSSPC